MKKRKGNLLQRMMAALLAAALIVGMALSSPERTYGVMAAGDAAAISCSLDGGTTWTGCDALEDILWLPGYFSCKNPIIRLNKDVTVDGAGVILLYKNNNVLVDGQGYTIKRGTNKSYLFDVNQAGTLTFQNVTIDGGAVWNDAGNVETRTNSGFSAGGNAWLIYCSNADAEIILDNGTILQNNHLNNSRYNGAAVMMESGSLRMKDGAVIRNNTATGFVEDEDGECVFYGGGGGAVHVNSGASFTMEGGGIYGNYTSYCGGAIVNEGYFTLRGGAIHDNVSGNNGGAVTAKGTTVISGGEIRDNESFTGGGIMVLAGTTKISGGEVYGNTATVGGGICNEAGLSVSGTAKINDNSNWNVYLSSGKIINIDAPLSEGAVIGVMTQAAPTDGNPVDVTGHNQDDYSSYFTSDNPDYEIANGDDNVLQLTTVSTEEHKHDDVTFTAWTKTGSLPTDAGNYYLTENVTLTGTWNVPNGTTNLCLNGKTVRISSVSEEKLFELVTIPVSDTLNLYDCQNSGKITGEAGSGIWNEGAFSMYGGKISGNTEADYGGGVRNIGTFRMYGGEISGNNAFYFGGGVYVSSGTFYMCGGKISGNINDEGGGVSIYEGTFIVGGDAVISGNVYEGKANNVYLKNGQTIELDSDKPLSGSASIGVATKIAPTDGNPVDVTGHNKNDYSSYFTSDNPDYEIMDNNNVVQLTVKEKPHTHSLTLTEAKAATCTEAGNTAYYACGGGCGKYFTDAEGTQEIKDKNSVVIPAAGHSYDETAWGYQGADGHAHNCRSCDAHSEVQAHTPGAAATATTPQTCTVCGYEIAPATGESHTHAYGDWQYDSTQHWKRCFCGGEIDRATHDFGSWITDREATAAEAGARRRECRTCHYSEAEVIPATGTEPGTDPGIDPGTGSEIKPGTVIPEVKPGANAPAASISNLTEEFQEMLLTESERQQVQNGTDIRIVLEVQDAGNTVDASDKDSIRQAYDGGTVGQYLDISLYKLAGETRTDITETAGKLRIVLAVPDGLKTTDGRRTFAVVRVHDGRAELLEDLDDSADTITIETDRFSAYAIVYKDAVKDDEPATGDVSPLELCAALILFVCVSWLVLYFTDWKRKIRGEKR